MVDGKNPQVEFTGVGQSGAWPPAVSHSPSAPPGAGSQAIGKRVWVQLEVDEWAGTACYLSGKTIPFHKMLRNSATLCPQLRAKLKCCSQSKWRFVLTTLLFSGVSLPWRLLYLQKLFAEWFPDDNRVQFLLKWDGSWMPVPASEITATFFHCWFPAAWEAESCSPQTLTLSLILILAVGVVAPGSRSNP